MSEPELKSCPFCGSDAEIQWESTQGFVSCTNADCYATSTWFSSDDAGEVEKYIVPRWNRRPWPPAPTTDIQELLDFYVDEVGDVWPNARLVIERVRLWLEAVAGEAQP